MANQFAVLQSPLVRRSQTLVMSEGPYRGTTGAQQPKRRPQRSRMRKNPRSGQQLRVFALKHRVLRYLRQSKRSVLAMGASVRKGLLLCSCGLLKRAATKLGPIRVDRPNNALAVTQLQKDVRFLRRRMLRVEQQLLRSAQSRDKVESKSSSSSSSSSNNNNNNNIISTSASAKVAGAETASSSSASATFKYERMLAVGVPQDAVAQTMANDGVHPTLVFRNAFAKGAFTKGAPKTKSSMVPKLATKLAPKMAPMKIRSGVSASMFQNVTLRKAEQTQTQVRMATGKVSLAALLDVKLRSSSRKKKQTQTSQTERIPSLGQLQNVKLKRASPGGTPFQKAAMRKLRAAPVQRSPSLARSNGEFLELALKRKFAGSRALSPVGEESRGVPDTPWS